jgi:hypothetical protein
LSIASADFISTACGYFQPIRPGTHFRNQRVQPGDGYQGTASGVEFQVESGRALLDPAKPEGPEKSDFLEIEPAFSLRFSS